MYLLLIPDIANKTLDECRQTVPPLYSPSGDSLLRFLCKPYKFLYE